MPFAKVGPGSGHHWIRLRSKFEMIHFLIIFDSLSHKNWMSFLWIISKFTFWHRLVVDWLFTKFVMSSDLIQSILTSKGFVPYKVGCVRFSIISFLGLRHKVLAPTFRMIPMAPLQLISLLIINDYSLKRTAIIPLEMTLIHSIKPMLLITDIKICLSHLGSFVFDFEEGIVLLKWRVLWVSELSMVKGRSINWFVYKERWLIKTVMEKR